MSWMQKLCQAYDSGIDSDQTNESCPLIPVGFTQKKVKYRIELAPDGGFVAASQLPDNTLLLMPTTPEAEIRTGDKASPFPLTEQLKYLVWADGESNPRYNAYRAQLDAWSRELEAPAYLQAVLTYLAKKTIVQDMQSCLPKFKYVKADEGAMVCFAMQGRGDLCALKEVRDSWSEYSERTQGEKAFCYVEGRVLPVCKLHPKVEGNAKLISSKDTEYPFQYQGRFTQEAPSVSVSSIASMKMHNALKWLVARQGYRFYGVTWVVWNTNGSSMKQRFDTEDDDEQNEKPLIDTFAPYAAAMREAAAGWMCDLQAYSERRTNEAVILGMTAATDGRMSVLYYQEMPGNDYVGKLEAWYKYCCWWRYRNKRTEIGTPGLKQLARAILGRTIVKSADEDAQNKTSASKQMRELQTRLLICIASGTAIPDNMLQRAFARACAPLAFAGKDGRWHRMDWEECLRAACAMIHHRRFANHQDAECAHHPELDRRSRDRSYLYGRLLAVADKLERDARAKERDSQTNAIRMMYKFSQRPRETWLQLHNQLIPYLAKLKKGAGRFQTLFAEIESLFLPRDRALTSALGWSFLQGYSSQTQDFYRKKDEAEKDEAQGMSCQLSLSDGRDALYGCLLGIADVAELATTDFEHAGNTNALRLMRTFTARPLDTWPQIHDRLIPYLEKLITSDRPHRDYLALFGAVARRFTEADCVSVAALESEVLSGYYRMRGALLSKGGGVDIANEQPEPPNLQESRAVIFGKMLGIADRTERIAQQLASTDVRPTNALRLMACVGQTPKTGWQYLRMKLLPYQNRLATKFGNDVTEQARLEHLEHLLDEGNWMTDERLDGSYLHVYYMNRWEKE